MLHLINVPRFTLTISIFLIFILFPPMAAAKHIIIVYDVSGSMVSLRVGERVITYMESEDIRRVNEYLTDLLFTNTSQSLRDRVNDSYIKECDAAFVGKPLYQSGDVLTYAEYAEERTPKINRAQVSKTEFQQQLPNRDSLNGQVSYLLRAEVEVYDVLYNNADDETYWVFVTDGDIDNSGKSDPDVSRILKRLAEIEEEFFDPMIYGVFVNNHVKIEVRRLQKRDDIDSIFIATSTKSKEPVQEIQLSLDEEGKFFSETLTIDTESSEKTKFNLSNVNVEIVDRDNRPLQITNEGSTTGILSVDPVELHGNPPPHEFRILLPGNREIAAPDNRMNLEVTYSFNGEDKVFTAPQMNYTVEIKIIYVARLNDPDRPAKQLELLFSDDKYSESLTIQTESPKIDAFQIDQIQCHIQYRDNRKLSDAVVPKKIKRIDEPFSVEVPKQDRLDWHGNKVVLEIDYKYEEETLSKTIEIPYKLVGGGTGFPIWLLWVLLVPVLGVIVFFLIRKIIGWIKVEHRIRLTQVSEAGTPLHETAHFILENEMILDFGPRGPNELRFDVGSEAFLHCVKKNLILFADGDDEEGQILDLPETLTLSRGGDEDDVHVKCEITDDAYDEPEEDDDANPLDM